MKTFLIDNNFKGSEHGGTISWHNVADSALSNMGKPYFMPEKGSVSAAFSPAVLIGRLGKSIQPKFAHRYMGAIVPVIHFRIMSYYDQLRQSSLPTDPAISYDKSVFVGTKTDISELPGLSDDWLLLINGEEKAVWQKENLKWNVDEIISEISILNTLKNGDLIIPGLSEFFPVNIGDKIEIRQKNNILQTVKIK